MTIDFSNSRKIIKVSMPPPRERELNSNLAHEVDIEIEQEFDATGLVVPLAPDHLWLMDTNSSTVPDGGAKPVDALQDLTLNAPFSVVDSSIWPDKGAQVLQNSSASHSQRVRGNPSGSLDITRNSANFAVEFLEYPTTGNDLLFFFVTVFNTSNSLRAWKQLILRDDGKLYIQWQNFGANLSGLIGPIFSEPLELNRIYSIHHTSIFNGISSSVSNRLYLDGVLAATYGTGNPAADDSGGYDNSLRSRQPFTAGTPIPDYFPPVKFHEFSLWQTRNLTDTQIRAIADWQLANGSLSLVVDGTYTP